MRLGVLVQLESKLFSPRGAAAHVGLELLRFVDLRVEALDLVGGALSDDVTCLACFVRGAICSSKDTQTLLDGLAFADDHRPPLLSRVQLIFERRKLGLQGLELPRELGFALGQLGVLSSKLAHALRDRVAGLCIRRQLRLNASVQRLTRRALRLAP